MAERGVAVNYSAINRWVLKFAPTWRDGKKTQVVIALVEHWILEQHKAYRFASVVLDQYKLQQRQPVNKQIPNKARSRSLVNPSVNSRLNSFKVRIFPCPFPATFIG